MSSAVIFPAQPEQILKGLGKLWTSLGQEEKQQGKPTVLRACAMTLIVATDEPDGEYNAAQSISELMREHPSRGIVLAVSDQAEHGLEARVVAQCWKPFGKAQQICCEQIEITAKPDSWPNVGPTLIGLTVADLPIVFWCRHQAALGPTATEEQKAGLQAVLDISTKVIVDTGGQDAASAMKLMSRLRENDCIVADLQWTTLTAWRQPIAQLFNNPTRENPFANFRIIEIHHAEDKPSPMALYLAGWLSSFNGARVAFRQEKGFGSGLQRIRLLSEAETIEFERTGADSMHLFSTNGRERTFTYSEPSLYSLLNEELSVIGGDPVFDRAFTRAQEILNG